MVSSGDFALDKILGGEGYPAQSTILVIGPPGIGKEALGYWLIKSGLEQGDFCLYLTRLPVKEVLLDQKAYGIDNSQRVPLWFATDGGQIKYDMNDLSGLSYKIKEVLKQNQGRRIRIVIDVLSSLLVLNPPETIYKFFTQLFTDVKQYDAVVLATIEEGMHPPQVLATMQQLFDGVIEMKLYQEGLRFLTLLRIMKMRGLLVQPGYIDFSLTRSGLEVRTYVR